MNSSEFVPTNQGWVAWFARNPVAANLLMVFILVAGILTALNLELEDFPALPPDSVTVSVVYESGSASTTEESVTIKLEETLSGIPGIKQISSTSSGAESHLTIQSTSGYPLDVLYQDVKSHIDSVTSLPEEAEKPVIRMQLQIKEALNVHLYGKSDQQTLQETARKLRDTLLANPVIDEIYFGGMKTPEISIQVDEQTLQALGLSLSDIAQRVRESSVIAEGGELFSQDGELVIRADHPRYYQQQFEQIQIKETDQGQRLLLSDIATVSDSYTQSGMISRFNGQPGVLLEIMRYPGSDNMLIADAVQQEVNNFRQYLPQDLYIQTWNDSSGFIKERLGLLLDNSIMGILLVMLLLSLFLNIRVAFWVGAGLPVIFAGAMLLLGPSFYDLSLNEITTYGFIIALGIVVDDAVVVGESVYAERERNGASIESTIRGAQRVTVPTVYGVLTTMVAFLALSFLEGNMGKIFAMFAYTAAFCLIFSLIESKLILPAHLAHIKMETGYSTNPVIRSWQWLQTRISRCLKFWINHIYRPFLHHALELRYATLLVALTIFILVVGMVPSGKIRAVFFPDVPENTVTVSMTLEQEAGYGLVQSQALDIEAAGLRISDELQQRYQLDEAPIRHLMTLTDNSSAKFIAELSSRDARPFDAHYLVDQWQQAVGTLEAVQRLRFITDHEDEADISIELRAQSPEQLAAAGTQVQTALAEYAGVSGVQSSMKAAQPQIDLELKPEGLALGLTTAMLAEQIQQAYQGYEVQRIQRGRDEVKVRVRYPDHQRRSITDLNNAHIRTLEGKVIPLKSVAHISSRYVEKEIERIDRSRVAVITADLDKKIADSNDILTELEGKLFKQLQQTYPGLVVALTGEAQEEAEATQSLIVSFAVSLLAIYALLAIPLKSYTQPLLIMSVIPFGIISALLGLWLHALSLSIVAIIGILALSGVVVNDSLLLISRFNEYCQQGKPVRQAMIEACCSRTRAIFLTSITTYVGLVPLMLDSSESAQMLIPAAVALGYGILFATLITLILIPSLVLIKEDIHNWNRSVFTDTPSSRLVAKEEAGLIQ